MSLSVLLEKEGRWQPTVFEGTSEQPMPDELEQLKEWVAYRVIGPTGARSKVVKEEQTEVQVEVPAPPNRPGSKPHVRKEFHVQQTVELSSIELLARQPEWSAPCWKNTCSEATAAGVNIEHILLGQGAGADVPLGNQAQLEELLAAAKSTQAQLCRATIARLAAKLLNESENKHLQLALMAEGATGLWDLTCDRQLQQQIGLTGQALHGLMAALRKPVLSAELHLPAVCAAWQACVMAKSRERLIQYGVVEVLLHIADSAFSHLSLAGITQSVTISNSSMAGRQCSRKEYLALLTASLGALAVLAVDSQARKFIITNKLGLRLLADVAGTSDQFRTPPAENNQQQVPLELEAQHLAADSAERAAVAAAAPTAHSMPAATVPALNCTAEAVLLEEAAVTREITLIDVSGPADKDAGDSSLCSIQCTAEAAVVIPAELLSYQPNQLAAEVLAAVLLRDSAARAACLESGSYRLLLSLTGSPDAAVQLCGAAAVASMAATVHPSGGSTGLMLREPQLLWDMYASLQHVLQQAVHRQQQRQQQAGAAAVAAGSDEQHSRELDDMLIDYGSLALWVVASALSPLFSSVEVLQQLAAAGQLAWDCIQWRGATSTSHAVAVCMSGVLCIIVSTQAAAQAAADADASVAPADIVHALQPAVSAVLLLEASGPEVTQAKLLAAVVVMLLAGFDRPECQHHRSNSFCSPLLCAPSPVGPEQQQLPEHTEVNPHPPFRGVFRDALHAQGLLPAVLGLVMHSSSNSSTAEDHEQQAFDLGTHDRHTVSHFTPPCSSPLFDDGQGTRTLIGQVVAAACQLLVAVNQPLPLASCAQVLDFLWDQITYQQAPAAAIAAADTAATAMHDRHTNRPESTATAANRVHLPGAAYYAVTLWCLSQHEQQQQQLLLDGRWSQLLCWLVAPALHRIKRAVAAGARRRASAVGYDEGAAIGHTLIFATVPRLQLQVLQQPGTGAAAATNAPNAAGNSSKRATEAANIVRLCVQSCWLLMQQEAKMRLLAAELPADLKAVYAKGACSYWAMEVEAPSPPELSPSAKQGLSVFVNTLDLPDSWEMGLKLKALALKCSWCLAAADKAFHAHLIELGLPQCAACVCQNAAVLCSNIHCGHSNSRTDTGTAVDNLLVAAAGYLTVAVQQNAAVQALGGEHATVQVLVSALTACTTQSGPAGVNVALLVNTLSSLAWLSSSKHAAAACCNSKATAALMDVLRLERQAYKAVEAVARQHMPCTEQPQQQARQPVVKFQRGFTQSGSGGKPLSPAPSVATAAARPSSPGKEYKQQEKMHIPPLPIAVLQAPFVSLQQPDRWVHTWLQQQHRSSAVTVPSSPTAASRHGSRPASPGPLSALKSCTSARQQVASIQSSPKSAGRAVRCRPASAAGSRPGTASGTRQHGCPLTARPASPGPSSSSAGLASSRSVGTSSCAPWDHDSSICDSHPADYQEFGTPDGTEGMLALWALLNISVHHAGQTRICKKGLYTLIRLVQECPDPQRVSVATAVLGNLTNARENTAMIYKAELRLKHAALLRQAGMQRVLTNPARGKEAASNSSEPASAAAADGYQPEEDQPWPGDQTGPAAALSGRKSLVRTARRASALSMAAEAGVLTAILCTTHRGLPKGGISSEEHQAGVLLSRVSEMTSRNVVSVYRPDKASAGSFRRPAGSGSVSNSAAGGQVAKREGFTSTSGGFGTAVRELIPAAAGMATSQYSTPRAGEGFSMEPGTTAAAADAAAGASSTSAAVPDAQEVKAAFMRWLQEQMPEAVGATAASSPSTPGPATQASTGKCGAGGRMSPGHDSMEDLATVADLAHTTTEDLDEDDWLEQQRVAQELHEFYTARAAQGQLLRGSLVSSLRASTSTLWSRNEASSPQQGFRVGASAAQQPGVVKELVRPQSAPPGGLRSPAVIRNGGSSVAMGSNSYAVHHGAAPVSHSNSRPTTPAVRTSNPGKYLTPTSHGYSRAMSPDSTSSRHVSSSSCASGRGRPQSAAPRAVCESSRPLSPQRGQSCCVNPWAPAVVAFEQLPATNITKPWQVANQLLVVRPEEEVVQELAAAATSMLEGRLPRDSPQDVLNASIRRKQALEQIMQQCQLHKQQQPQAKDWSMPTAQQDNASSAEHTAGAVLLAGPVSPRDSPVATSIGHPCSTMDDVSIKQGSIVQHHSQVPIAGSTAGNMEGSSTCQVALPGLEVAPATDGQATAASQPDRLRVTWGAGMAATASGADSHIADVTATRGDAEYGPSTHWHQLHITCDDALQAGDMVGQGTCSTTASARQGAQEDVLLLQRPKTAYAVPNSGTLYGKQYIPELRGTFSTAVADSLRKHKQERMSHSSMAAAGQLAVTATAVGVPASIPRPVTVVEVTSETAAKPVQMLVRGVDDITLPQRAFQFHKKDPPAEPAVAMHVFEHVDGAQFCSGLYGHYLLPNGKLAHFFVPPAALKQGHTVTLPLPPVTPWEPYDWLPDGLPASPAAEVLQSYLQPELAVARLPVLRGLNWVPVPQLAPQPSSCSLTATKNADGGLVLQPGPMRLKVVVQKVFEQREFRRPMSAKLAAERRRSSTMGAATGLGSQQPQLQQQPRPVPAATSKEI